MPILRAKHRICRRVGAPVCGRPNCPALRRPFPAWLPGRRRRAPSEYGVRLLEKQKLKAMYGIGERQLRRYIQQAQRMPGRTGENLLVLLERRLDNLVRRLGFALTIHQARQLVSHGHVAVDGRRVDIPSYQVGPGQKIEVRKKDLVHVAEAILVTPEIPPYLEREISDLSGRLVRMPRREEIPHPVEVEERLVVEFYAR